MAALLAAAGLMVSGMTAAQAAGADTAPAATAGTGTDTPSLVTGLSDEVSATASPADAARGHLKARKGRYHIADTAAKDLTSLGTTTGKGGRETVRLQQKYQGVEVLGGQYLVRMTKKDGKRTVTGTSGQYFTHLKLDTVTPKVAEKTAVQRAVGAVAAQLGGGRLTAPAKGGGLSGTEQGLVVLPQGTGVLTRHITVAGVNPADGSPVQQEVYIDGHSGFPVMQYSSIQTFGANGTASGAGEDLAPAPEAGAGTQSQLVVKGSGTRLDGEKADLNLYQGADGAYQMIDYGRRDTWGTKVYMQTYDARGKEAGDASGRWPSGIKPFASATPELGADYTDSGAVDAHWAAGQVYDYYKGTFGRDSLDGKGGPINSLVGVVNHGQPYNNAFWDGQKMVYGQGGGDYLPFSADTDVVGHEMTHGVIEHTANLVYVGQSGAMNEALADYFGNAIDVEANHQSMSDPDTSLLGEDLCVTAGPRECALRDLDDGATTKDDFVGVTVRGDSGGVHLNSTIFSGALWDIRQKLGGKLADQVVYRALSAYMTPLDGFTDGRNAVVAAARELGFTKTQLDAVNQAFDAHGIANGWESKIGVDAQTLMSDVNTYSTKTGAGGGHYAASRSNGDGSEPFSVWTGRTDGKGTPQLVSENNGDYNVYPDTDGRTVVWADYGAGSVRIMARPVDGGTAKVIGASGTEAFGLTVDGDFAAYTTVDPSTLAQHVVVIDIKKGTSTVVDGASPRYTTVLPSIKDGVVAYAKMSANPTGYELGVETYDAVTGKTTTMPVDSKTVAGIGQTAVTDDGVFWVEDGDATDDGKASVQRAALDGSNRTTITPESGSGARYAYEITASDDAVTLTDLPPATSWSNATLPKLYQVAPDGKGGAQRMSCDRGDQVYPAADTGKRVVWIDGSTGHTNLVTRDKPAGKC